MKANYVPPKGVIQLTYNVSLKEITRLKKIAKGSKTEEEKFGIAAIVSVKCGKQSDNNYEKWDIASEPVCILNFYNKGIHVYMKCVYITRSFSKDFGIRYKIATSTIKELPK